MSKRLKVLFVTSWYPVADRPHFGIFIRDLAKAARIYDDVVILHLFGPDRNLKKLYHIERETDPLLTQGLTVFRVRYRKTVFPFNFFQYPVYIYAVLTAFREIRKRFHPDIIHAHIFRAGFFACLIKMFYHIEFLLTEHSSSVQMHKLSFGELLRLKLIGRCCPLIIAVSESLKKEILSYGVRSPVKVLPNTVDTTRFRYFPREKKPPYKILTLCNLIPGKGVDVLLKAIFLLKRKDFVVLIGGEGPQKKTLLELIKKLGIEERVNFLGFVSQDKKTKLFQECDIFVLPSYKETFGVVLIEAMACGKPVIATRCGGPEDFVKPKVGELVPPGDPKSLADTLNKMLANISIYKPEEISKYAKERFSYQNMGEKLHNIYSSLIPVFMKYPVGYASYKIKIKDNWKVLDVGSGHNPHPRANVILDKYIGDNKERSGKPIKIISGQKFIRDDVCTMPFKNKKFDYIIASHIAEHVDNPKRFCEELMRVGRRGYIECPSKFTETLLGERFHKWYVFHKKDVLIFEKKRNRNCLDIMGRVFYALFYISTKRENRYTLTSRSGTLGKIGFFIIKYPLQKLWRIVRKITYTCYQWEGKFNYRIIE